MNIQIVVFAVILISLYMYVHNDNAYVQNTNSLDPVVEDNGQREVIESVMLGNKQNNTKKSTEIYPDFNKRRKNIRYDGFSDISKIEKQLESITTKPMNMNVLKDDTVIPLNELSGVMNRVMCAINKVCDNIVLVGIDKSTRALSEYNGEKWATYTIYAEMYNVNANQTLQFMIYTSVHVNSDKKIPQFKIHAIQLSTMYVLKDKQIYEKLTYNESNDLPSLSECSKFSPFVLA